MAAYLPLFNYEITQQGLFFSLENGERRIGRVSCLQSVYEAAVNVTVTRDIAIVRRGRILGVSVDSGVFFFRTRSQLGQPGLEENPVSPLVITTFDSRRRSFRRDSIRSGPSKRKRKDKEQMATRIISILLICQSCPFIYSTFVVSFCFN